MARKKVRKTKKAKKPKLWTGKRFKKLEGEIEKEYEAKGYSKEEAKRIAGATAAKVGMKKYGKKKFLKKAHQAKKSKKKNRKR